MTIFLQTTKQDQHVSLDFVVPLVWRVCNSSGDALHGAVLARVVVHHVDAGHLVLVVDAVADADEDGGLGHVGGVVALADDVGDAGRECQSHDHESDQEWEEDLGKNQCI